MLIMEFMEAWKKKQSQKTQNLQTFTDLCQKKKNNEMKDITYLESESRVPFDPREVLILEV